MSQETLEWLNQNVLVGFTDQRGNAWHYRMSEQGDEPNHYPGAIPQDDVLRRLFSWEAIEHPLYIQLDGKLVQVSNRKGIFRSDFIAMAEVNPAIDHIDPMGIFKDSYVGHPYAEWLLKNVSNILDDNLQIGSAGLLSGGAKAWVSVEVPDTISTPEGVDFRPQLLATTSFDGTIATTYKRVITVVVCDNTREAALREDGQELKIRHSKYSGMRLTEAREALAIVHTMADDFSAQIAEWTAEKVEDAEFDRILDILIPLPEEDGRGKTRAENKRDDIRRLYKYDNRCAPWNGTAFGVLQTFSTWQQHENTIRGDGAIRAERNMEKTISGDFGKKDSLVLDAVQSVLN